MVRLGQVRVFNVHIQRFNFYSEIWNINSFIYIYFFFFSWLLLYFMFQGVFLVGFFFFWFIIFFFCLFVGFGGGVFVRFWGFFTLLFLTIISIVAIFIVKFIGTMTGRALRIEKQI